MIEVQQAMSFEDGGNEESNSSGNNNGDTSAYTENTSYNSKKNFSQEFGLVPPTISRLLNSEENSSRNSFFSDIDDKGYKPIDPYLKVGLLYGKGKLHFEGDEVGVDDYDYDYDYDEVDDDQDKYKYNFNNDDVDVAAGFSNFKHTDICSFHRKENGGGGGGGGGRAVDEDGLPSFGLPLKQKNKHALNFMDDFLTTSRNSQETLLVTPTPKVASPLRNDSLLGSTDNSKSVSEKNVHFAATNHIDDFHRSSGSRSPRSRPGSRPGSRAVTGDIGERPVSSMSMVSSTSLVFLNAHQMNIHFINSLDQGLLSLKQDRQNSGNDNGRAVSETAEQERRVSFEMLKGNTGHSISTTTHESGSKVGVTSTSTSSLKKPHIENLIDNANNLSLIMDNQFPSGRSSSLNHFPELNIAPSTNSGPRNYSGTTGVSQKSKSLYSSENSSFALSTQNYGESEDDIDLLNESRPGTAISYVSRERDPSMVKLDEFMTTYPLYNNLSLTNKTEWGGSHHDLDGSRAGLHRNTENIDREELGRIEKYKNTEFREFNSSMIKEYETEEAMQLFIETIEFVLKLPHKEDVLSESSNESQSHETFPDNQNTSINDLFEIFHMKGHASMPFANFIKNRIQPRCEYSPMIYLNSAYLLLNLITDYNCVKKGLPKAENHTADSNAPPSSSLEFTDKKGQTEGELIQLVFPVTKHHIHKLIVALLRLSGKLIEDNVHSTSFFAKIVGVNKKNLVQLETSLLKILLHASKFDIENSEEEPAKTENSTGWDCDFNWLLVNNMKLIELVNLVTYSGN